jgi:hypothetical protein
MKPFAFLVLVLFVFWILNTAYHRYVIDKSKYKFFRLRDELRNLALDNEISSENELFIFLDFQLSKTISNMYFLNLYIALIIHLRYSKLKEHKLIKKKFEYEFSRDEKLNKILIKYQSICNTYIKERHYILYFFYRVLLSGEFKKQTREYKSESVRDISVYRERMEMVLA